VFDVRDAAAHVEQRPSLPHTIYAAAPPTHYNIRTIHHIAVATVLLLKKCK